MAKKTIGHRATRVGSKPKKKAGRVVRKSTSRHIFAGDFFSEASGRTGPEARTRARMKLATGLASTTTKRPQDKKQVADAQRAFLLEARRARKSANTAANKAAAARRREAAAKRNAARKKASKRTADARRRASKPRKV